jgi:hypothetical protein
MIDAGGNGRECDGAQSSGLAKRDGAPIARGEKLVLAFAAAVPDRPDGVDHMARPQPISFCDLGVAGRAAAQCQALRKQLGPGRAVNGPIDAAAAKQRIVGGVNNGVDIQRRDVGDDDVQRRVADLTAARAQADAAALTAMPLSANNCCNSPAWNISRTMSQPPTNSPFT